jgi:hypothetical protein
MYVVVNCRINGWERVRLEKLEVLYNEHYAARFNADCPFELELINVPGSSIKEGVLILTFPGAHWLIDRLENRIEHASSHIIADRYRNLVCKIKSEIYDVFYEGNNDDLFR